MIPIENREVIIPADETSHLFIHTTGVWGEFHIDERGYIGSVHPSEIREVAEEWVNACNRALLGQKIVRGMIDEKDDISDDIESVQTLVTLTRSLGTDTPYADRLQIIERAKNAFQFLSDPNTQLKLTQQDIDAAELLVSKLDGYYKPRNIKPPIVK